MIKVIKLSEKKIERLIFYLILLACFIFFLIINLQLGSSTMEKLIRNIDSDGLFLSSMNSVNHSFFNENNDPLTLENLTNIFFSLATSIRTTDHRSFIRNGLPGLSYYDTEIVVAGEGTDLTTLPYESTPPIEVLLKEMEVAEENLKENTSPNNTILPSPEESNVFIYHTHNMESFLPLLKNTTNPKEAITSDERANVIGLGKYLTSKLLNNGLKVYHDKTNINQELLKRDWKYSDSYSMSNEIVNAATSKYPNLEYFIDIHRDSARKEKTTKILDGKAYAKLYFIVGKENKDYKKNLAFAEKLNAEIENKYPGISRGVFLKTKVDGNGVYNQDVSDRAILIEVGGVDNNLDELNRTLDIFAEVFADVYWKENEGNKE
ncbi:stage II sporulation protein P [Cytobacillus solani]|uniref:stage II sporulation protein P n=1 Tax=Cytobacillus solani TaxID=1637975 RepID=UPI001FE6AF69|nr:stage II sporulation protein P [Cytobacillus solani]